MKKIASFAILMLGVITALSASKKIEGKANEIIFPRIEYSELSLDRVFIDITRRSQMHDKEKTGINVIPVIKDFSKYTPIVLAAENISVMDTVKMVCSSSNLTYEVSGNVIKVKASKQKSEIDQGETFYLKSVKSKKKYGPYVMENGSVIAIGKSKFTITTSASKSKSEIDIELMEKLKSTSFPSIDFQEAQLATTIRYVLNNAYKQYSKNKETINYILPSDLSGKVSLSVKGTSAYEVLELICEKYNFNFKLVDSAVIFYK